MFMNASVTHCENFVVAANRHPVRAGGGAPCTRPLLYGGGSPAQTIAHYRQMNSAILKWFKVKCHFCDITSPQLTFFTLMKCIVPINA